MDDDLYVIKQSILDTIEIMESGQTKEAHARLKDTVAAIEKMEKFYKRKDKIAYVDDTGKI